jgi:hypothetical protein
MELMFQMHLDIWKGDTENRNIELELRDSNTLKASNRGTEFQGPNQSRANIAYDVIFPSQIENAVSRFIGEVS